MSTKSDKKDSLWATRIANARKFHTKWSNEYRCATLEKYYKGNQWRTKSTSPLVGYKPYMLNLFYSTIKIKASTCLYQKPQYVVSPRPGNMDQDMDTAVKSATIKGDVLNTIVSNPNAKFAKIMKRIFTDSFFRFGMCEIGYAADFRNPLKPEPYYASYDDPDIDVKKDKIITEVELPQNERFYIKRIKPHRFLVSVSEVEDLEDHDWVGYLEFYYTRMLRNTKGIKFDDDNNIESINVAQTDISGFVNESNTATVRELMSDQDVTPVWRIWSMIEGKQKLLRDGDFKEIWSDSFNRLPLTDLRWDEELNGFYPIPPAFQWLSPQDEINEAREQVRSYRRRFTRKFQAMEDMVDEGEKEKFASGQDGVIITVKQPNAITPIDNPEMGPTAQLALIEAKDDFNTISGTSTEARGQNSDRETATAAKITDVRAQVRESAEQLDYGSFMGLVGREILAQAQEKLVTGMWIKYTSSPGEGVMQDQSNTPVYRWIKAEDISDGYDFDVDLDILNNTPQAQQQAQQSFVSFLSIVQNFPAVALSPVLIRQAAYVCGYRNEKVIQQYQQAAALSMAMKAAMQAGIQAPGIQAPGNPQNAAGSQVDQMASPIPAQVQNQQTNQQIGV